MCPERCRRTRRELALDLVDGELLEVAEQAVAGVVHQDVDPTDACHRIVVAQLLQAPAGRHDPVPGLESGPDGLSAAAAAGSRDKPDLAHDFSSPFAHERIQPAAAVPSTSPLGARNSTKSAGPGVMADTQPS